MKTDHHPRGRVVAITRPAGQAGGLATLLAASGIETLLVPAIRRVPPASFAELDEGIAKLLQGAYSGVLFTSPAAVEAFFSRPAGRLQGGLVIGAVGQGTAGALRARGVPVAVVPEQEDGVGLAEALIERFGAEDLRGMRFLQPRAAEGRQELSRCLGAAGASVDVVDAYRTLLADAAALEGLRAALAADAIGAVVYASPSAVRAVVEALGGCGAVPAVAIGATTAVALQAAGVRRVLVAARADDEALAEAALQALGG